jgi:hypothetical protein
MIRYCIRKICHCTTSWKSWTYSISSNPIIGCPFIVICSYTFRYPNRVFRLASPLIALLVFSIFFMPSTCPDHFVLHRVTNLIISDKGWKVVKVHIYTYFFPSFCYFRIPFTRGCYFGFMYWRYKGHCSCCDANEMRMIFSPSYLNLVNIMWSEWKYKFPQNNTLHWGSRDYLSHNSQALMNKLCSIAVKLSTVITIICLTYWPHMSPPSPCGTSF